MIYQTISDQLVADMGTRVETNLLQLFEQVYFGGVIVLLITIFGIIAWLCYAEKGELPEAENSQAQNKSTRPTPERAYDRPSSLWSMPQWFKHPSAH